MSTETNKKKADKSDKIYGQPCEYTGRISPAGFIPASVPPFQRAGEQAMGES